MTAFLDLRPLREDIGAQVRGVDRTRLVSDERLAGAVRAALEAHGVLVFHDLNLDPETQVAFCRTLGEVDLSPGHHPVAGIYRVSRDVTKNSKADYLKGTFDWHIDGCTPLDDAAPQMATVLSAKAVARSGGETEFASMYAAYDNLTAAEQERFLKLRVVHSLEASQRRVTPDPTDEQVATWCRWPTREHPLVWTHRSGRRSLVLGTSADHVVGLPQQESALLLSGLLHRATTEKRVYRHTWSVGDTVIWDNRGVIHRAAPYPADSPREMLRTTVLGDEHIQ